MGDNLELLAIRTGADRKMFAQERETSSLEGREVSRITTGRGNFLKRIFHIITDALRTWIYSSTKAKRKVQIPETHSFSHSSYLKASAIAGFANAMNSGTAMVIDAIGTFKDQEINYPEKDGDKLLALPVVLSGGCFGFAPDHIVTFVFDPVANTLEYYDSKGLSIEERASAQTIQGLPLEKIREDLVEKYGAKDFIQNRARHQTDIHNCGVYVCDYLLRRSEGKLPGEIHGKGLTFAEANGSRRQDFIDFVEKNAAPQSVNTNFEEDLAFDIDI